MGQSTKAFDEVLDRENDPKGKALAIAWLNARMKYDAYVNPKGKEIDILVRNSKFKFEVECSQTWRAGVWRHGMMNVLDRKTEHFEKDDAYFLWFNAKGTYCIVVKAKYVRLSEEEGRKYWWSTHLNPDGDYFLPIAREEFQQYCLADDGINGPKIVQYVQEMIDNEEKIDYSIFGGEEWRLDLSQRKR